MYIPSDRTAVPSTALPNSQTLCSTFPHCPEPYRLQSRTLDIPEINTTTKIEIESIIMGYVMVQSRKPIVNMTLVQSLYLSGASSYCVSQIVASSTVRCPLPATKPIYLTKWYVRLLAQIQTNNWLSSNMCISLPYNKEGIAINMPWLHRILPILEHNLHKFMEISPHDRSLEISVAPSRAGGHASNIENSRDVEVVGKFQRGIWGNVGDTVDSIPLLAIDIRSGVCKHDGSTGFDQSIVVRSLRVWSRSTCCQIPAGLRIIGKTAHENKYWLILKYRIYSCFF